LIRKWHCPDSEKGIFIFCITARLLETKGYKELLKAFAAVRKNHPEVHLKIYGDGNLQKWIESFCMENNLQDCVFLYGNLPDAWQYLYTSNCFIFPSWYEGISGSLIEAAIMGIPIIASDIPMNLEVIDKLPNTLVHKLKDEKELEKCMELMIKDYRTYMAKTALTRELIKKKFDIGLITEQYENKLRSWV
jgi:glycosyltransferase involved in cell wall biosynthesis